MLIIYDKNTKEIVSISGWRGKTPSTFEVDNIKIVDLPDNQLEYRIYDKNIMDSIWANHEVKAEIKLEFDTEGNPTGVTLTPIINLTAPETIEVNTTAEISTDYEATLYVDGIKKTTSTRWELQFEAVGVYEIKVDAGKHGTVARKVIVE